MFGALDYEQHQLISLATALPGLPETRWLLPVSQKVMAPFVFFQSLEVPSLCLLATPARVVKADYRLELGPEERQLLGLAPHGSAPNDGKLESSEVGAFAFVSVSTSQVATANLLAPLVIHLPRNVAIQAIQPLDESFLRYPLDIAVEGVDRC